MIEGYGAERDLGYPILGLDAVQHNEGYVNSSSPVEG